MRILNLPFKTDKELNILKYIFRENPVISYVKEINEDLLKRVVNNLKMEYFRAESIIQKNGNFHIFYMVIINIYIGDKSDKFYICLTGMLKEYIF